MTEFDDKIKYLNDLKSERIKRPATKGAYLKLIAKTEQEISSLIAQKDQVAEQSRLDAIATQEARQATSEFKWDQIRSQRSQLLLECDWTQLGDSPLLASEIIHWQQYRQELRDITLQPDPDAIIWPVAPES